MADTLSQLVETQQAVDGLIRRLELEQEAYTFSPKDDKSLMKLFEKTEEITKEKTRRFLNLLAKKMEDRDRLDQEIPELKLSSYPEFVEGNLDSTTESDITSLKYWDEIIIPALRKKHRELLEAERSKGEGEEESSKNKTKDAKEAKAAMELAKAVVTSGAARSQSGSTRQVDTSFVQPTNPEDRVRAQAANDPMAQQSAFDQTVYEGSRVYNQLMQTELTLLERALIMEFGGDPNTDRLPPELRGMIWGEVQAQILKGNINLFDKSGLTLMGRTKLFRQSLLSLSQNISFITPLQIHFTKTVSQKNRAKTQEVKVSFTPKVVQNITSSIQDAQSDPDSPINVTQARKEQFKKEMKKVLAASSLANADTVNYYTQLIIKAFPNAPALYTPGTRMYTNGIDQFKLERYLPKVPFSVNEVEYQEFLDMVNKEMTRLNKNRLRKAFARRGSKERNKLDQEYKDIFYVSSGLSTQQLEGEMDQIFDEISKMRNDRELTHQELKELLSKKLLKLNARDADQVTKDVYNTLVFGDSSRLTTAQLTTLQDSNYLLTLTSNDAANKIFRSRGIDGIHLNKFIKALDAYALTYSSVEGVHAVVGRIREGLPPELRSDPTLRLYIEKYIALKKGEFASLAENQYLSGVESDRTTEDITNEALSYNALQEKYSADGVALAFNHPGALSIAENATAQQIALIQEAQEIRDLFIQQTILEENKYVSDEEMMQYGQELGLPESQYLEQNEQGQQVLGQRGRGLIGMMRGGRPLRKKAANKLATTVAKQGVRTLGRTALLGASAGLATGGVALAISSLLNIGKAATLGAVGGAGLGGTAGFLIAGPVGAVVGGILGGITGAVAGFFAGGGSPELASTLSSAAQATTIGAKSSLASSAGAAGKAGLTGADAAAKIFTGNFSPVSTLSPTTFTGAALTVATPTIAIGVTSILTTMMVTGAFLPDASTVQVSPSYSTDIVESPYLSVRKTPSVTNSLTPTNITYSIVITKKPDVTETITLGAVTDSVSVLKKDEGDVETPALPEELLAQLNALNGRVVNAGETIQITFEINTSDAKYEDSLLRNDVKVTFKADAFEVEANGRAQTCFGDCPKSVIAPCWPVLGTITQPPYATGPLSSPILNEVARLMDISHFKYKEDAYDISKAGIFGEPVFAVASGTILTAETSRGPDGADIDGDGNITEIIVVGYGKHVAIDHGGFISYYGHLSEFGVSVGQPINGGDLVGYVGSTGNSTGPHLHYEIKGTTEYVMIDTYGISTAGVTTNGPRCDEYYGKQN